MVEYPLGEYPLSGDEKPKKTYMQAIRETSLASRHRKPVIACRELKQRMFEIHIMQHQAREAQRGNTGKAQS